MDLKQLAAAGAFVPRTLFMKEVPIRRPLLKPAEEWADPEVPEATGEFSDDSITVWIRKRSSADFMEIRGAEKRDRMHVAVQRCVCHEDGAEVFDSLDKAKQLAEWLFVPLMSAVLEVNDPGGAVKNSQPRTSSGASSRSASAGGRSQNGRRPSPKRSSSSGISTRPNAAP